MSAAALNVVELTQRLIRFDTSNPPGNERACVEYIRELVEAAGLEAIVRTRDPERPNLIARLCGRGERPPLLLHGHIDVVPAPDPARWMHDPFAGEIVDGELWGRGAIDMKGGVAMMLTALLHLAESGTVPRGDVLVAALSDEEGGSSYGAQFLVERHPELFADVRYAVGEFGGIAPAGHGGNVYLVPVAEKQWCTLRVVLRGTGGHGSLPSRGGVLARLADILTRLDRTRLPHHLPAVSAAMIDAYANALPSARGEGIRSLVDPARADEILDAANGALAVFDAALHNTVTPTAVRAGDRVDAVPDSAELRLDGRVLPGQTPANLVEEVRAVCAADRAIEVLRADEPSDDLVDTSLLPVLTESLQDLDPGATVAPMLSPGVTDGRFFARLGIRHHGFLPMQIPDPAAIIQTMHGANERVPVGALEFGTQVFQRLLLSA